jgi:hypothetical protein
MGRRYFSHGSSFGRTLSCFIVRSSAHDSVVFAVGRFRLRTRVGDASQLRSRARRKNMDSVHSPCRVDALHHAAQLLQAGLRDADGVLLLDGDEELGRHGRSLLRVREQVPLGSRRPDGGHDCLAPLEVTLGQKNRRAPKQRKRPLREKKSFSSVATKPRRRPLSTAPRARVSSRNAIFAILARDAPPRGCHASAGLRASRCSSSSKAFDQRRCPARSTGADLP